MISSLTSYVQSFVQPIGIVPVGILAMLSILVFVGLVAGIYQEMKLRKVRQDRRPPRATSYGSNEIEEGGSADRT
jgi:hypothetical protein